MNGPGNGVGSLEGLKPYALVSIQGGTDRYPLFIDTGARKTTLTSGLAMVAPGKLTDLRPATSRLQGAGSKSDTRPAQLAAAVTFGLGDAVVPLKDVLVLQDLRKESVGTLGQDLLDSGKGFSLDFERMKLILH